MCPASPIPGVLGLKPWVCRWVPLFIVIKHWLMLHNLISLQTIFFSSLCVQTICTFLSLQTIFLRIFHPPSKK
jgi:hypothetical protein